MRATVSKLRQVCSLYLTAKVTRAHTYKELIVFDALNSGSVIYVVFGQMDGCAEMS